MCWQPSQLPGYRPSAAGRALRTQRSLSIALRLYPAVDGVNGTIMDRFVHSLAVAAQHEGYRISLFAADSADDEVEVIDALHRASSIDVAVLTDTLTGDTRPAGLIAARVPFVAFGRPWGERGDSHCWVDVDGSVGTEAATRSLRADGHTRIGFLGWPAGSGVGDDRRAGWVRAVSDLPGLAGTRPGRRRRRPAGRRGSSRAARTRRDRARLRLGLPRPRRAHRLPGPPQGRPAAPGRLR